MNLENGYFTPKFFQKQAVELKGLQGQKRWDKTATTGYENVRRLTHENLLPALQRFSIVVSRLRGLSKFEESRVALGLETLEFDQIFDTICCLQLLCHTILIYAGVELRQFIAFSAWVRQEIETQATDPMSSAAEESIDKDVMLDYQQILDYVQGAMQQSQLFELFDMQQPDEQRPDWEAMDGVSPLYDRYKIEVRKMRDGTRPERRLPGLHSLLLRLDRQCKVVFERTASAQRQKVRFGQSLRVGQATDHYDMTMIPKVCLGH